VPQPENYAGKAYSCKVDVFSFAVIAYETLASQRAYTKLYLTADQIVEGVAKRGLRPTIPASWPPALRGLLSRAWDEEPDNRPPFSAIVPELEGLIAAPGGLPQKQKRLSLRGLQRMSSHSPSSNSPSALPSLGVVP
jgi:hypothetical protein